MKRASAIRLITTSPAGRPFAATAITNARQSNTRFLTDNRLDLMIGRVVHHVWFDLNTVVCRLGDSADLVIQAAENGLLVRTAIEPPPIRPRDVTLSSEISLTCDGNRWTWRPDSLAARMVGDEITQLFFDGQFFYLYFSKWIVSFSSIMAEPPIARLLYWDETD